MLILFAVAEAVRNHSLPIAEISTTTTQLVRACGICAGSEAPLPNALGSPDGHERRSISGRSGERTIRLQQKEGHAMSRKGGLDRGICQRKGRKGWWVRLYVSGRQRWFRCDTKSQAKAL